MPTCIQLIFGRLWVERLNFLKPIPAKVYFKTTSSGNTKTTSSGNTTKMDSWVLQSWATNIFEADPKSYYCNSRHGICQMFYTSEIPNFFNFTKKNKNCNTFEKGGCFTKSRLNKLSVFFASIYSNTNSHQPICKNSNLNLANSTKLVVFRVNFTPAQGHSTQVPFVPLMTNFMRLNKWLNLFKCILGLTSKLCVLCTSDNHRIVFAVCSFAPTTGCRNRLVTFLVAWKVAAGKKEDWNAKSIWMVITILAFA